MARAFVQGAVARQRTDRTALWAEYSLPIVVTLLALALRLFRLGDWSFWGDEFFTVTGFEDGFNYSFLRRSLASDLIQFTVRLFGPTEWVARIVPALIGVLTVLALYFLLKPVAPKWTPLLAALLLAISPWHLYWSQNARFYTLLLLFSAMSAIFYYRGLEEDRPGFLLLALLFLGLAARERLVAFFLIPVFALYPLLLSLLRFEKPLGMRASRLLLFFGPVLFSAALFALPYVLTFDQWMRNFGPPTNAPQRILAGVVLYQTVPITCLAVFGGARLILLKRRPGLFFSLLAFVPLLLIMVISLVHYAANRYVFLALTGWLVLAAWAIQDLFDQVGNSGKLLAGGVLATVIAVCLVDIGLYFVDWNGNRQDWRSALHYIRDNSLPTDVVVANDVDLAEHYLDRPALPLEAVDWSAPLSTRVWLVEEEGAWKSHSDVMVWAQENGRLMAVFDVHAPGRVFPMRVHLATSEPTE
ncbi:MAG: glycosyltransferase family 39 protein [Anaerolineae bacterium]|nr:glycosyltransferase family 39 protein [Anaerolineae bacterium]